MRELIENNPARWHDAGVLDALRGLCQRAWAVMHDPVCRARLTAIEDYAAAVPWGGSDRGWSPRRLFGPWFLRREVLRKLQMLSDRLTELQADRSAPHTRDKPLRQVLATPEEAARRRERYGAVLCKAAESVGGTGRLAFILRVPQEQLERWIEGKEEAPLEAFLASLDLVAAGPFTRETTTNRDATAPPQAAPVIRARADLSWAAGLLTWRARPARGAALAALSLVALSIAYVSIRERSDGQPAQGAVRAAASVPHTIDPPKPAVRPASEPEKPAAALKRVKQSRPAVRVAALAPKAAGAAYRPAAFDGACSSLSGLASLQCLRCANASAFSAPFCREKARLEYCERRDAPEALCPSPIPGSSPW